MDIDKSKSDLDFYREQLEYANANKNTSPMVSEQNLPIPITPASGSSIKSHEEEELVNLDIELSFFQCEFCGEWKTEDDIFLIETNQADIIREPDEPPFKTLIRDVQAWCSECILSVLDKHDTEINKKSIEKVNIYIKQAKNERQKIIRVQEQEDNVAAYPQKEQPGSE